MMYRNGGMASTGAGAPASNIEDRWGAAQMGISGLSRLQAEEGVQARRMISHRQRLARALDATGLLPLVEGARNLVGSRLRILAYHRVLTIRDEDAFAFDLDLISASVEQFREQMAFVKRHFHPLTFREWLGIADAGDSPPRDAIVVTFDDGYDDNYRVAFPILRELGVPAVFFVSTGHIDSALPYAYDWLVYIICSTRAARVQIGALDLDVAVPPTIPERRALAADVLDRMKTMSAIGQSETIRELADQLGMPRVGAHDDCRPMTWDELREMHAAGMEIGSHGVSHHMLSKLPRAEMTRELQDSQAALTRELGVPAVSLSYPVGGRDAFDGEVIEAARGASFRVGCSYISGDNPWRPRDLFDLHRLHVEKDLDLSWFRALLAWPALFGHRSRPRTG
jgi:peptidoglycan/xylan/chitin deacetylase (PgdA/CDA1 family)